MKYFFPLAVFAVLFGGLLAFVHVVTALFLAAVLTALIFS